MWEFFFNRIFLGIITWTIQNEISTVCWEYSWKNLPNVSVLFNFKQKLKKDYSINSPSNPSNSKSVQNHPLLQNFIDFFYDRSRNTSQTLASEYCSHPSILHWIRLSIYCPGKYWRNSYLKETSGAKINNRKKFCRYHETATYSAELFAWKWNSP